MSEDLTERERVLLAIIGHAWRQLRHCGCQTVLPSGKTCRHICLDRADSLKKYIDKFANGEEIHIGKQCGVLNCFFEEEHVH